MCRGPVCLLGVVFRARGSHSCMRTGRPPPVPSLAERGVHAGDHRESDQPPPLPVSAGTKEPTVVSTSPLRCNYPCDRNQSESSPNTKGGQLRSDALRCRGPRIFQRLASPLYCIISQEILKKGLSKRWLTIMNIDLRFIFNPICFTRKSSIMLFCVS